MKKILSIMAVAIIAATFTSCIEEKACEKNNTGEITVVNDNPFAIMVDVMNDEHTDAGENIEATLQANTSKTYTMTAGLEARVYVKFPDDIYWENTDTKTPTQCVTSTSTYAFCSYNGNRYAKEIKSINNTGRTSVVDIWSIVAGRYMGEVTLYDNETAYHYNVPAGDFKYYIRYLDYDNHTLSDTYTVSRCGEHSMTWTSSKMANSEKSNMVKDSNPYLPFESLGTPSIKK